MVSYLFSEMSQVCSRTITTPYTQFLEVMSLNCIVKLNDSIFEDDSIY
jgi:hypothetical protein